MASLGDYIKSLPVDETKLTLSEWSAITGHFPNLTLEMAQAIVDDFRAWLDFNAHKLTEDQ